ncbi:MAG TPA: carbohydrate ABC transporter permease [Dictyoglomaceae bacterium]|nr:carbohydrate ABC transporter permease [Dictyoglomaceae bacterium]HOL39888.1 carbohydrate ABC transporter permease [Dictyoglomaceae bacterium]HOP95282.1 carbohydrate ABC transporter permease [Dictyoglomaceae bacterium]HPP16288.1 carbohydrate ABC transporter permease [Dictyoglomaceae bacterium]HPU43261.1 carbohydrate ABC transporter permease [Dictyoglomaceae bacterium]
MINFFKKNYGIIRTFDFKRHYVKAIYFLLVLIALLAALIAIFPIIWTILSGFKTLSEFVNEPRLLPESYDIGKFIKTWNLLGFGRFYVNSLIVVVGSVIFSILCNGLLGYSLSKVKPKGYKLIYSLILWSLMIPSTTSIVPLFLNIVNLGLQGSFIPLWISAGANAFFVILYKNFFDSIPQSIVEAARIDGCSEWSIFFKIIFPLSYSINAVVAIFTVTAAWSDFLLPYLLLNNTGKETVMVRLFQFRTSIATDVDIIRAVTFSIIPPIILFAFFQRYMMEGIAKGGIKG